jgi:hypothetical protein
VLRSDPTPEVQISTQMLRIHPLGHSPAVKAHALVHVYMTCITCVVHCGGVVMLRQPPPPPRQRCVVLQLATCAPQARVNPCV